MHFFIIFSLAKVKKKQTLYLKGLWPMFSCFGTILYSIIQKNTGIRYDFALRKILYHPKLTTLLTTLHLFLPSKNVKKALPKLSGMPINTRFNLNYSIIVATLPEPTVLPPSRIAKPSPCSIPIGWISSTVISTLSPGMHISVPSGSWQTPVTSVVLK